jgi:hypothetical protein
MARPTDYNEEILEKTKEYVNSCTDTEADKETGITKKVNLPTIEGLAYYISVNRDTIYDWCKVHKEFSDIIDNLRAKQAKELINKGLSGDYNPTIAKVLLTKHGYREGIDATTNDKTIGEQTPESLAKGEAFNQWYKTQISKE